MWRWDPHREATHTPGNFHVFDPAVERKNKPRHGLQANYGKSGITKQSQGIPSKFFRSDCVMQQGRSRVTWPG